MADTDALDLLVCDWLGSHGMIDQKTRPWLLRIQPGKLAAFTFGYGGELEVRLSTDLIAWLFLFDDAYADGRCARDPFALRRVHEAIEMVLDGGAPGDDPFARSLADLFARLRRAAPAPWIGRLAASLRLYFRGCEIETSYRFAGATPTIEGYLAYRDGSVGVYPMLDVIELASSSYLTEAEARSPFMVASRRAANLVIALTNDLHSADKEAKERDSFNAVLVAERQLRCDRATAVLHTRELQRRLLAEHRHFEAVVKRAPSDAALRYFAGVDVWFDANARWSSECPRYNALGGDPAPAYADHVAPVE